MARGGNGCQRIHAIVIALKRPTDSALRLPLENHVEAVVIAQVRDFPAQAVFSAELLDF